MVKKRAATKIDASRRYRGDYETTLRRLLRERDDGRPLKFKVYELVRAFIRMRRREAGIDARSNRRQADAYEIQTLQMLCTWVRGRDSDLDACREDLHKIQGSEESAKIDATLERYLAATRRKFSREQSRRAKKRKTKSVVDVYIREVLKKRPHISAKELFKRIESDERLEGYPADIIEEVTGNEIFAVDPKTGNKEEPVKISGLGSRLSRIRKQKK